MEAQELFRFEKGRPYLIVSKQDEKALRVIESKPENFKASRLNFAPRNQFDNFQLFIIEQVSLEKDSFEILSCPTGLVLTEDSKEIELRFGKQSASQLYLIEKVPLEAYYEYYWIKTTIAGTKALQMEGILRIAPFDPNNESQMFRFEKVKNNPTLKESKLITNRLSGKCLDVPESSFEKGERIIQWAKTRRFNQRWVLVPCEKGVYIRSVLTGYNLDISGESRDEGAKVIVWAHTGNPNQRWSIEEDGGYCRIRSLHEQSLLLCIKKDDIDDGGKLECTKENRPSTYWKIEAGEEDIVK